MGIGQSTDNYSQRESAFRANVYKKFHHKLRFLTADESWELLQYEVYDEVNVVPDELKRAGDLISENCDGLPLSIVVIGGILKDQISEAHGDFSRIKKEWDDVAARIQTYLVNGDLGKRLEKIVRLGYETLPYEQRDCFLYLGMFPEDAHIPVKRLTLLWIAEGFVQQTDGKSLEETAHDNVRDLIGRNLLMVEKEKLSREVKICRVHDTVRQFCITEAKTQNFFQEISQTDGRVFEPSLENVGNYHRLCIHSYVSEFLMIKPKVHNARTFLFFPKSPINLDTKDMTPVTDSFQLLRVLDAEKIRFPKFPQKLVQLIHLRYLTLAFSNDQTKFLPEIMSSLWNLQTLIVEVPTTRTLSIRADIFMMRHLRHLKSKAAIILKNIEGTSEGGENLQTLGRLSPESCTEAVFNKARNLVQLGIQGELSFLLNFRSLGKLGSLNKLKLKHVVHNGEPSGNPLRQLPAPIRFPPNLKVLEGHNLLVDPLKTINPQT